jgi:type IV pilus assembly protein PilB
MHLSAIKKRLGDLLVDVGIITAAQLKQALETQQHTGDKLGVILAQMGLINEEVMLAFLGKQCGVSYISLTEYGDIPGEVTKTIPENIVRHQNLIPISKDGKVITVAMADPFNVFAIDDIKMITGYDVEVVIASESEIKTAIEKYYIPQNDFDSSLQNLPAELKNSSGDNKGALLERTVLSPMLSVALKHGVSKIFLEPNESYMSVRCRIDGFLKEQARLSKDLASMIILHFAKLGKSVFGKNCSVEFETKIEVDRQKKRALVDILETHYGESISIEVLKDLSEPIELGKLGFEPETMSVFKKNIEAPSGLIIITGPACSGKTTTLYSTMKTLNYPDKKIIAFETRSEYLVPGTIQVPVADMHSCGKDELLRIIARHEPDIVFIEDLLEDEMSHIAMDAILSGRTVITTMVAGSCVEAFSKLIGSGIPPSLIASSLLMITSQKLMRVVCKTCRETYDLPVANLKAIGYEAHDPEQTEIKLKKGAGCPECGNTGYSGRVAVFEAFELDEKTKSLIAEKASESAFKEHFEQKKYLSSHEAALRKVISGISSVEEILRLAKN